MTRGSIVLSLWAAVWLCGCASSPSPRRSAPAAASTAVVTPAAGAAVPTSPQAAAAVVQTELTNQVIATERAFARSMADRNFKAFLSFLSPEAVFFSGTNVRHGPAEIAQQWQAYFEPGATPFSWSPDHVEVLASGKLALSTGPVMQQGKIVGRFTSLWRLDAPNSWHVVFDKGESVCSAGS